MRSEPILILNTDQRACSVSGIEIVGIILGAQGASRDGEANQGSDREPQISVPVNRIHTII